MDQVKVTRGFQVTLPKEVREITGIKIGDYLLVYVDEKGRIVIEKVREKRKNVEIREDAESRGDRYVDSKRIG
jgi:AbrB family looped-hinge helix DNA binding protein